MTSVKVNGDEVKQWAKRLKSMEPKLNRELQDAINETAQDIVSDAKLGISKPYQEGGAVDTGRTRSAIHSRKKGDLLVWVGVFDDAAAALIARYIEYGTHHKRMPPPAALQRWVERHGMSQIRRRGRGNTRVNARRDRDQWRIAYLIARKILRQGGLRPRPFLWPAVERARPEFKKRVAEAVERALESK